jgi:hypothetical protein
MSEPLRDKISAREFARTAQFEDRKVTVRGLVHYLCSHDQQHLAGPQWLLAGIEAAVRT